MYIETDPRKRIVEKKAIRFADGVAKLIAKVAEISLDKPSRHPWEMYLSSMSKEERHVSRMGCEILPDNTTDSEIRDKLSSIISEESGEILLNGEYRQASDSEVTKHVDLQDNKFTKPTIVVFTENSSADDIISFFNEAHENCWMAMGIVRDKGGRKFLFSAGDHLAQDGNFYMGIFAKLQKELMDTFDNNEVEKGQEYEDGEKNIVTQVIDSNMGIGYKEIYSAIVRYLTNKEKKGSLYGVVFPVLEEIAEHKRMLPMHIPIVVGNTSNDALQDQLRSTIKDDRKIDSPSIKWIRMLYESKAVLKKAYNLLHRSPLGKIADRYYKGQLLFSVMESDIPVSSTTIVPNNDSIVCTVVREPETKNVLAISLSGNDTYWPKEEIKSVLSHVLREVGVLNNDE